MLRLVRSPINAFALGLGLVFSEVLHKLLLLDVCAHYCCTWVVVVLWRWHQLRLLCGRHQCTWGNEAHDISAESSIVKTAGRGHGEGKAEIHLLVGKARWLKENCFWISHIWNSKFLKTSDGETIKRTRRYLQLCNWKLFRLNSFMVPNTHFKNRWR